MNRFPYVSTRAMFAVVALGLFLGRIVPLYLLDRTEFSREKRKQDPFTRTMKISSRPGQTTGSDTDQAEESPESSTDRTSGDATIRIPPEHLANYLLGNLIGGLKQAAVTSLWMKYNRLKEEQRYEEAVALLQVLKMLQPEREQVWSFLGWNIAYEFSKRQPSLEREWAKIRQALRVLEDGISRMEESITLHKEIGWIHGHRIPQELYFMKQVWNEKKKTNYRISVRYLTMARELAKDQNRISTFLRNYGRMINYTFYDIVMLLHFGEHERALNRVSRARDLTKALISDYRNEQSVPRPHRVRLESYRDLPDVIRADQNLADVPWETAEQRTNNRKRKIKRTQQFLKAWSQFFHDYSGTLAEEAVRHVLRRSFELLYYVTRDLERFYRTGEQKFRKRAETLSDQLIQAVSRLAPEGSNVGGGYLKQGENDLGTFWQQMNENFRLQRKLNTTGDQQVKENVKREMEGVYSELLNLYNRKHFGFRMPWLRQELDRLEAEAGFGEGL